MATINVSFTAIILAVISAQVIGYLWYGPLFGKIWMILSGIKKKDCDNVNMTKVTILSILGNIFTSYTLFHISVMSQSFFSITSRQAALTSGFWIWLGFIVPLVLGPVLWEGKPFKLFFLNAGYQLVSILSMSYIISYWM